MKCPQCGAEANQQAVYCHQCGARLVVDEPLFGAEPPGTGEIKANTGPAEAPTPPAGLGRSRRNPPEQELWEGTYSPKAMFGLWILDGLVTVAAVVLIVLLPAYWWIGVAALVLFSIFLALTLLYRRFSVHYRLTTQRLFHQYGLLSRRTDRIEVIDMDDVSTFQNPVERLFGVGSIRITSSDKTHPEFWIRGIEDVQRVALMMDDARREERIRRGFHIESV